MYIETEKISNDTTQVNFSGHLYFNTNDTSEKELKPILDNIAVDIEYVVNERFKRAGYLVLHKHLVKLKIKEKEK